MSINLTGYNQASPPGDTSHVDDNDATNAPIRDDIKQNLQDLPVEMRNAQRFFPVKADKSPIIKEWQNPDNQRYRHDVAGLKGFDVCGHGRGVDYLFMDFDHVLNDDGEFLYKDAEKWFNFLSDFGETFCERSISGHGLHMFAVPTADKFQKIASGQRGQIVFDKAVGAKIELFYKPRGRYCLVTGDLFRCEPTATIPHGEVADDMFQQLLNAIAASNPARESSEQSAQTDDSQAGNELEIMRDILRIVDPNQLNDYFDWRNLLFCSKLYGVPFEEFDAFSARDKRTRANGQPMYDSAVLQEMWNSAETADQVKDGSVKLGTAIKIAEPFGYRPPRRNPHVTGDKDADEWQKVNGVFNKQLYLEIRAAEKFLQELTPETLTATVASSSSTARKIALCTFYDFALTAAQKFWLRLEDAIANAVAQVKTAKTTGEILSDDGRLLAQLKVNDVRKTVDREVKAVQRAHEKFQDKAKAKQQAKAAKARLDKYMQNAPTTRKVIDDCPVDLIIPPDVYFGQEVGLQVILPNGTASQRPAALAPVTVTKKFRNESTGEVMFEIAIKTCDAWRRHEIDGKSLQSARSVDVLGNFGLPIEDAGALAKFFARIIAANDKTLTVTKVFTQTGWTDDDSTDFVYPSQDADYCVRRAGFDFAKELACRGDVDTWTKTFVDAMKAGGSKARVYVGTALAAPLIRKFNIPNLQTHLHGTSGSGKTALEKLTASILGNPRLLIRTFEATPKNRQAVAAAFNDLPMFLDELGTINGKKGEDALSQSIYAYSLGNQNQAQQRNGDTRPLVKFYGSRLSTGERAILKNHDARGNFKRLLEIQCDKMFDDRVAAELHLVAEKNFGHFGRKWIEYVTKHVDEICAQFDDYAVIFTGGHNQREPTLIKAVVAAAVAFQHFMICAGAQVEFDEATCENDAGTIIETLPTLDDMSDDVRAIAALKSFVAAHPKHFMFECEDDKQTISDTTVWATPTFGKHFSDGRVAFLPTELQKILEDELGFASKDALVDAWHRKGLLVTNGNRRDYRITLGKTRPATICFKQSVLSEGYEPRTVYAPPIISSAQNETD